MIPLEPCPYCGGMAKVNSYGSQTWCECMDCGATVKVDGADNIQSAMAKWNRRANQ